MKAPHYLIETSHRPRVLAYVFAFVIVVSPVVERSLTAGHALFAVFLLLYPYLVKWLMIRFGNSGKSAGNAMLVDAGMVGVLIAGVQFNLLPSTVLLTLLTPYPLKWNWTPFDNA